MNKRETLAKVCEEYYKTFWNANRSETELENIEARLEKTLTPITFLRTWRFNAHNDVH